MPAVPGHEPLGIIAAMGDKAAKRWGVDVGDRVAVETMLACHTCPTCLGGKYHLCDDRRIYSYIASTEGPGLWCGYAQYMFLDPFSIVHKMDKSMAPEHAVMFNPLGAGYRWAVEVPQTKIGDTVFIMGPGQLGLASVIACREAGAKTIIVTGLEADENKMRLAKLFGADHVIDVQNQNAKKLVHEYTQGKGADVVVDV
jgi:threonine dehydrogenase-like Zn-dependent dehydrogenase